LKHGDLDFGFAQSDLAYDAYKRNPDLRQVFSLYMESLIVLARADSGIQTFQHLKGKRVNIGVPGSGGHALVQRLMRLKGWAPQSFKALTEIKVADQAKMLCEGEVDALVYSAGHPNGAIQEVTNLCATRAIPLDEESVAALVGENPYYYETNIPAEMYRGIVQPVLTVGVKALLLTTKQESDDNVYQLVKAVFNNLDNFKGLHPVFAAFTPENMMPDKEIPLHPAAEKFYIKQEVGK
jgi:uncharacterized protein